MSNSDDKYPSWRDALFSNDTVANIRCAIKYIFWHMSYAAIGLIGVVLVGVATVIGKVTRTELAWKVKRAATSDRAHAIGEAISELIIATYIVFMIEFVIYLLITDPTILMEFLALLVGTAIVSVVIILVVEKVLPQALNRASDPAKRVANRAKETPGVRRVYGNCPVSMSIEPRWFKKLFEEENR